MATLYTTSPADGHAVAIAAALAGVELKVAEVKTVHNKSPANQGPVLETGDGGIFGLAACLRAVARSAPAAGLHGANFAETSQVDQWLDYAATTLKPAFDSWIIPIIKNKATEAAVTKSAKGSALGALRVFNAHLANNTFLVGHQVTIADIYLFIQLVEPMKLVLSKPALRPLASLKRWFETVQHDPAFAIVGEIEFCTKEQHPPRPVKKVEKKQEKKKEKKVVEKKKTDLELLPPTTMNLDTIKKLYFNQVPYNPNFFSEFWPQFDHSGYSVWVADYKYNSDNDNEPFWKTENLVGGYMQRLETRERRNNAFGVLLLTGADQEDKTPWKHVCCYIMRGPRVFHEFLETPGSDNFAFSQLDVTTDAGKAKFEEYFRADVVNGEPVQARRYHK
jgi:elongation factor 1-gamma